MDSDQIDDVVFPDTSDYIREPSPSDSAAAAYNDGALQGNIYFPPYNSDTDCGTNGEVLYSLVASVTSNYVNMDKLLQSVVVDTSRNSYNKRNSLYLIDGRPAFLSFDKMAVFETYNTKCLSLMDRKRVHIYGS